MSLQKAKQTFYKKSEKDFELIKGEKYLWKIKKTDEKKILSICSDHNLSQPVARILLNKGYYTKKEINSFLFSSFEDNVFDSSLLKDSKLALERLERAVEGKERILVFGDYDVDGITSTALLMICLLPLGANINFYLPNRAKEGYGLSKKAVEKAVKNGYDLLITVDNGITAFDAAQLAYQSGLDLIITDHHRPHEKLPKAIAIIDANQPGCKYPYKDLAGVGVIFKLVKMLYEKKGLEVPDKVYELLMLGTIADVAPLTKENRFWVRFGLSKVNKQKSIAIKSLAKNSRLEKDCFDSLDIAFMIAPQINALGRLDDPRQAVEFLVSSNLFEVERIGRILKGINEERKKLDRKIYLDIESAILEKRIDLDNENIIMAVSSDWPTGIIGLVAGRLVQNYGKPTFLFHLDKSGILKGSCRSIPEFNIFEALNGCKDILQSFGGHSFAAGLRLKQDNLPELKSRLENKITKELSPQDLIPKINVDSYLQLPELKMNFLSDFQKLEPFGNQNKQPVFVIKNVSILNKPVLLKDRHVKCSIFSEGVIKPIIFFNNPDFYKIFNNLGDKNFHVVAHVVKNEWGGRVNIELQGLDISIP
ncbi:single-stranded-DNA-specific exonuclease RecJ [Candidatus Babeliales bacterium]|nr:single-stranded-DNA-specific exonuclease RecJ [Candidatus Babeliales bacterium]